MYVAYFLTIFGWLMTQWTLLNDDDVIKDTSAISFARSVVPQMVYSKMQECLRVSHGCAHSFA